MLKVIKWSSFADIDLASLLEYLEINWNYKVCNDFLENLENCILQIQINPDQFMFFNKELQIRKCVVTKHNSLFYRETESRIEILR